MNSGWLQEDIESVLRQLDRDRLPFSQYTIFPGDNPPELLGQGASSYVYAGYGRDKGRRPVAIKVIGFQKEHIDREVFQKNLDLQKELGIPGGPVYVVRVLGYKEMRVWIQGSSHITRVEKLNIFSDEEPEDPSDGNYLYLQFVAMERLAPVIRKQEGAVPELFPEKLARFDEKEILHLACDIGTALNEAHKNGYIHRDVKLENVFYSEKEKRYKLGDFGEAGKTRGGFADTVAFTRGYGAPEVVNLRRESYDQTADIYSLGMMIYVLLNELRFPLSGNYTVNAAEQYRQGFVPPLPAHGSERLQYIVMRMCAYDPDERIQTLGEVMDLLGGERFGTFAFPGKKERQLTLGLASICFVGVSIMLSLTMPFGQISGWTFVFFGACILRELLYLAGIKHPMLTVGHILLAIPILMEGGISWPKTLILLLAIVFHYVAALYSMGAILGYLLGMVLEMKTMQIFSELYSGVIFLALAGFFLYFDYRLLDDAFDNERMGILGQKFLWLTFALIGVLFLELNVLMERYSANLLSQKITMFLINSGHKEMLDQNAAGFSPGRFLIMAPHRINYFALGILCLAFTALWVARRFVLDRIGRRKEREEFVKFK